MRAKVVGGLVLALLAGLAAPALAQSGQSRAGSNTASAPPPPPPGYTGGGEADSAMDSDVAAPELVPTQGRGGDNGDRGGHTAGATRAHRRHHGGDNGDRGSAAPPALAAPQTPPPDGTPPH